MKAKRAPRFAAAAWLVALGWFASPAVKADDTQVIVTPLMTAQATAEARGSFGVFLAALEDPKTTDAAVKIRRHGESTWLSAEQFLATARHETIQDWSLAGPDGRLYGNYLARIAVNASPELAPAIAAHLSSDPLPSL